MIIQRGKSYSYEQLQQIYLDCGYELLSSYDVYLDNGRSHARLDCKDIKTGYKYSVNVTNLRHEFSGKNKFDARNPFRVENLQKWCDENDVNLKILSIEKVGKRCNFVAVCYCGNKFEARVNSLLSCGKTRCASCTAKESKFELLTRNWLEENNIIFEQEVRFDDCRNIKPLPFDFKIEKDGEIILIEVDGFQHYYENQYTSKERLETQKKIDEIKTNYCKNHNYKLIRISYWLFRTDSYKNILYKTFLEK